MCVFRTHARPFSAREWDDGPTGRAATGREWDDRTGVGDGTHWTRGDGRGIADTQAIPNTDA